MDRALASSNYHKPGDWNSPLNGETKSKRKGISLATFFHGSGFTGSGEVRLASELSMRLTDLGGVEILAANVEYGQGTNTIFAQIAAQACKCLRISWTFISPTRQPYPIRARQCLAHDDDRRKTRRTGGSRTPPASWRARDFRSAARSNTSNSMETLWSRPAMIRRRTSIGMTQLIRETRMPLIRGAATSPRLKSTCSSMPRA